MDGRVEAAMLILERYGDHVCVISSMEHLYKDNHGIWRDERKEKTDLVGVWMPIKDYEAAATPRQLSLFD